VTDKIRLITEYTLNQYAVGAGAGDVVQLRRDLVHKDHNGRPTGRVSSAGSEWTVLPGVESEPDVIWLREPGGDRHTWDAASFWQWFELAPGTE
jgi:hypothetical protein